MVVQNVMVAEVADQVCKSPQALTKKGKVHEEVTWDSNLEVVVVGCVEYTSRDHDIVIQ